MRKWIQQKKLLSDPVNKTRLLEAINQPTKDHLVFESIEDLKETVGV